MLVLRRLTAWLLVIFELYKFFGNSPPHLPAKRNLFSLCDYWVLTTLLISLVIKKYRKFGCLDTLWCLDIQWGLNGFLHVFGHCGFLIRPILFPQSQVGYAFILLLKLLAKLFLSYFSYRFSKGINHPISHSLHLGIQRIAHPLQLSCHKLKFTVIERYF